ncbi:MAG: domain containing protein [Daejeonella sp.]|nr:domain containing protein [Daejeonella sp.]
MHFKQLTYGFLLFGVFFFFLPNKSCAQNTSNKGRDFWLGYGNHVRGFLNPQEPNAFNTQRMVVYLTSDVNTTATVEIGGLNYSKSYEIKANDVTIADVPQAAYLKDDGKYNLGIHITSEKPIVVYAHIYNQNISGATLILPTNTLGKDYYSINYSQESVEDNSYSYFFITAIEDNTEVEIIPSKNTKGGWTANTSHIINLNKGEVYQVLGATGSKQQLYLNLQQPGDPPFYKYFNLDLTGSRIRSISTSSAPCKKIAVFSGSGKTSIGCNDSLSSGDNLFQQIYPTAAWGKKFITIPLASRDYDIFRIIKSDPSAIVKLNETVINSLSFENNLYYEFSSKDINNIESDKSIQVVQYAVTMGNTLSCISKPESVGDPEMIFLNPLDQVLKKMTMYSTKAFNISNHYINVTIANQGVSSFRLDGLNASDKFKSIPNIPGYSYAKLTVASGTHNLSSDIGYNAIAYGFGMFESYGYAAGANLDLQSVEAISTVSKLSASSGCIGESFNFKVNLEYQTPKLVWNLDNNSTPIEQNFTVPDSTYLKDNQTIYVYKLNQTITYNEAKSYKVNVVVTTNFDNQCGGTEVKEFDFDVYNPPKANFLVSNTACLNEPVTFTDSSDGNGRDLKSWFWDFGDGKTSTEQNPSHIYKTIGNFVIKLAIHNESNCDASVFSDTISVVTIPVAKFLVPGPYCIDSKLIFNDQSTSLQGTIAKWYWDFGDGIVSNLKNPEHSYASPGVYTVKLKVENLSGCQSAEQPLTINVGATPIVEFKMPDFCLKDGTATFQNLSTNADESINQLSYKWDFYNPYNNTHQFSSSRNASNVYSQIGSDYLVSLTVTSINGCPQSVTKRFTVNGSDPRADFTVNNAGLCSGQEVLFKDISSVDFGNVTRIEWYFDYLNKKTADLVVQSDSLRNNLQRTYSHIYPLFHFPANKKFEVRMVVYSGTSCLNEKSKQIILNATPEVMFSTISSVCENDSPFKLTQASEINNVPGSGVYTGDGVNSINGMFDPLLAGAGEHAITYTFTNAAGCLDAKTQSIAVLEIPIVRNENMEVLEGQEYQLPAIADSGLVYNWDFTFDMSNNKILRPTIKPIEDIVYNLVVTNSNNCSAVGSVTVKVNKIPKIPNTFTPNGDNINDTWKILNLETYPDCTIEIFNRYGKKVFSSTGYNTAWDGRLNGTDVPLGTYYYIINPKKGRKQTTGSVTILR